MFYKKQGMPEESELVICTVKRILPHSIFATLDEYDKLEGMIHISEVSPGRIRNIRDFVKEGKKLVCKVLRVNKEKKHIDLSLRRVSVSLKKNKNTEHKQQQKAEKILELVAKKTKTTLEDIYKKVGFKLIEKYDNLNNCFQQYIRGDISLEKENLPEPYLKTLTEIIKEKIKLPSVSINQKVSLSTKSKDGINLIKKSFKETEKFCKEKKYNIQISYISAPLYSIHLTSSDFKTAQKEMKEITSFILSTTKTSKIAGVLIK